VAPRDVVAAMRRLRVTGDMEIEIDRFLGARDASLAKYAMVERPPAPAAARAELGVDAVATVALGVKDGAPIEEEDARRVAAVVAAALKVPLEAAEAAVAGRAERSLAMQQQQQAAGGAKGAGAK
jgi:1,3-beta-glucan synthase